jgi:ABC-2 type transport system permease protein
MNFRILGALIKKESLQIKRDPSAMLIAFILPLILLFIFGYGVNLDSNRIRIGLAVEDNNIAVASLINGFHGSPFLEVSMGKDSREFTEALVATKQRGIVVIPQDFSQKLAKQDAAPIQIITDGSEPNIAAFAYNYSRA